MSVYLCRWPNGDVSFVSARSRKAALFQLDRLADPSSCILIPVPNFQVDFRLGDNGKLEMEGFSGEAVLDALQQAYPGLDKLHDELQDDDLYYPLVCDEEVPKLTAEQDALVYMAVLAERHRHARQPVPPGICRQCEKAQGRGEPPICDQCMEELHRVRNRMEADLKDLDDIEF
jgi:hypothetical protein